MGCVEDESVPSALAQHWAGRYEEWARDQRPAWWDAAPGRWSPRGATRAGAIRTVRGGCRCGRCAFEARSGDEF
eukprot:2121279-Prymnesium_polylepis.1